MTKNNKNKLGIIQSRGLGDIIIALPIAKHYSDQGYNILWPICEEFYTSVVDHVPWVHWVPVPTDNYGNFFFNEPLKRLKALGCSDYICLYQSLNSNPELSDVPYFQLQKFDEFKYAKASVPFRKKWTLENCFISRLEQEQKLAKLVLPKDNRPYYVTHFVGSTFSFEPNLSYIPDDWVRVDVSDIKGFSIFDWVPIIKGAEALIALDSAVANLADQLDIQVDKYWIPRSHIHQTPVLGSDWTILEVPPGSSAQSKIFAAPPMTK